MHDIFETLQQTVMWYGQDDFPYRVDEMEQSHRYNVQNFLRRRAEHLRSRMLWRESRYMTEDTPPEVMAAWLRDNERMLMGSAEDWLNATPFMKALDKAIRDHGTIDGEVVDSHLVNEKELAGVGAAIARSTYRMKSVTGRLRPVSDPPLQGIPSSMPVEEEQELKSFECWKGHSDCTSKETCSENSYKDWENSHDTTECGGMQNGCQLCAHIW